jgi:hypothetical protein
MQETAALYGISEPTLYRILQRQTTSHALRRADFGVPRVPPKAELERYIALIAAMKVRTSNRKGRHLSTAGVIRLLECYGIETPEGLIHVPNGALKTPTVNRYLKQWGYDRTTLLRPSPAVRFQATSIKECWHFDLSPSDLKQPKARATILTLDGIQGQQREYITWLLDQCAGASASRPYAGTPE